jgi:hypothetical protein
MYRQRNKDRRCFNDKMSFPLVTNGRCVVDKDRRITPDRRLGNIHLELIDAENHQPSGRFTSSPSYAPGNKAADSA